LRIASVPAIAEATLMLYLALVSMNGTARPASLLSLRASAAPSACVTARPRGLPFQSDPSPCVSTSLLLPVASYVHAQNISTDRSIIVVRSCGRETGESRQVPDGGVRTDEEDTKGSILLCPHDLLQAMCRCFGFNGGVVAVVNMMGERI
jgi:hypothetical protein